MGTYATEKIRNLGIVAHGGAGKTSLAEAILFNTGMIDRLGRVDGAGDHGVEESVGRMGAGDDLGQAPDFLLGRGLVRHGLLARGCRAG